MKTNYLFALFVLALTSLVVLATPVPVTTVTIPNPRPGQAPFVNEVSAPMNGTNAVPYYSLAYRSVQNGTNTVNFVTVPMAYGSRTLRTIDTVIAATTYVEMTNSAAAVGITNLPPQVSGQP